MDRVSRLRADAGSGAASDESSASDPGFQTAEDFAAGSSNYISFSDEDASTPKRPADAPGASTPRHAATESFAPGLSPITQSTNELGGHIDAQNILSGGVEIFDDYNSNDGDGLVIDDDPSNVMEDDEIKACKSTEKVICEPIESADLSLSTDANLTLKDISESQLGNTDASPEQPVMNYDVILHIDGTNVDAVDIGNGLYLYRKDDGGELNAIQILQEEGQQPHFKFLKVREFGEGKLEVYEEQITEVPITAEELREQKLKENKEKDNEKSQHKSSHIPIKDVKKALVQETPASSITVTTKEDINLNPDVSACQKSIFGSSDQVKKPHGSVEPKLKQNPLKNLEGSRKSPILGNFTSMTLHSSPNREGAPVTKTTINLPLNPNRHTDNIKKTIEVSTDNSNFKCNEKSTVNSLLTSNSNKTETRVNRDSAVTTNLPTKIVVINDKNIVKDTSNSQVREKNNSALIEVNKAELKLEKSETPTEKSNNCQLEKSDVKVSVNNSLGVQNDIVKLDSKVLLEQKTIAESNLNVNVKSIDGKKEIQSNKSNVVSKWVLRSDSTEDKCKKERDKISIETKASSSCSNKNLTNDISAKTSTVDDEIKHVSLPPLNFSPAINIAKLNKISKVETNINAQPLKPKDSSVESEKKLLPNNDHDKSCIPKPKPLNIQKDACKHSVNTSQRSDIDQQKNVHGRLNNKDKLVEDDKKFVNKYISEAFGLKTSASGSVNSSDKDTIKNKSEPGTNSKIKSSIKPTNSFGDKTRKLDSPLRIDVESPNKPVPFGKWTEGDKKEYLNKLKDQKLPSSNPSVSPAKSYQLASSKNDMKRLEQKKRADTFERAHLSNALQAVEPLKPEDKSDEPEKNMKGLIDKTIEGLIKEQLLGASSRHSLLHPPIKTIEDPTDKSALDELERQMNELHGIPLLEKPVPKLYSSIKVNLGGTSSGSQERILSNTENSELVTSAITVNKSSKIPNLLPLNNSSTDTNDIKLPQKEKIHDNLDDDEDSEEETLDCEPVTGDMPWVPESIIKDSKKPSVVEVENNRDGMASKSNLNPVKRTNDNKCEVTEVEFDTFVRRNSTNQVTSTDNLVRTDFTSSKVSSFETETQFKTQKSSKTHGFVDATNHCEKNLNKNLNLHGSQHSNISQIPLAVYPTKKVVNDTVDTLNNAYSVSSINAVPQNLNYQTKVQMAYQSALSVKNKREPIKTVDDKVKLPFIGSNTEYSAHVASKLSATIDNREDSCNSQTAAHIDSADETKASDQSASKSKHQRKQVLTPVESPIIELIEPFELQQQNKKRKTDHKNQFENSQQSFVKRDFKNIAPKKNYLLGRSLINAESKKDDSKDISYQIRDETLVNKKTALQTDPVPIIIEVPDTPKRGRGRPRKNPIQNYSDISYNTNSSNKSSVSDSKDDDVDDDDSDEEGIIRENWTMGKINDNIVCPICNKLFRSENIVFKHVKHCSSLMMSPSKRACAAVDTSSSPKKGKIEKSVSNIPITAEKSNIKSYMKESVRDIVEVREKPVFTDSPSQVIVIEDSPGPLKEREDNTETKRSASVGIKQKDTAASQPKINKVGRPRSAVNHTCEICGKTFRQLSYLVHHKSMHNKEAPVLLQNKPVLSCEICRKEFRQLHHLVEHREIHNPTTATGSGLQRKFSVDRSEQKQKATDPPLLSKENFKKVVENSSEPFRCEPCDKSFRKLHHLVEHRETHDGVNKKNSPPSLVVHPAKAEQPVTAAPTCDVCGKAFRKLHHLIEHREQHNESSNMEKKEKKSSLLAKDIIHECSLCYMVFPNEPSLNKHYVICQKKKKSTKTTTSEDDQVIEEQPEAVDAEAALPTTAIEQSTNIKSADPVPSPLSSKRNSKEIIQPISVPTIPDKIQDATPETPKQTPKKKSPKSAKFGATVHKPAKIGATVTKRGRLSLTPLEENLDFKSKDSDDDVRYMINPSYKQESDEEREIFMNVCVGKRSSLQFDGPSAKAEFKRRRTSLQHPPKNQKLLPKISEKISKPPNVPTDKTKVENNVSNSAVPSTSSLAEDSDVKYSFPKTAKSQKNQKGTPKSQAAKLATEEILRKGDKRKSLTGIAKRKSLGKGALMKPKANMKKSETLNVASPKKIIKKQALEIRHLCDCGKPFSSATLLAQHASLAHTPPRVRKSRTAEPPPPALLAKRKASVTKHAGVPVALKRPRDNSNKLDK